ncbi:MULTISPECIES: hypothetical protein [Sphingobium]|uniref:Uncharacterized protein n=1 Tax=Sphingobium chungbukense TaxID=56193 RepID=A0A0M3AUA0_9SPHN|nr:MULTISPECIES: hypothetical protein [Sphingobium]KKW93747.1 hypothetical protein YP76_03520 [Sphingobium chungbukense]PJG48226.1 hypothetical protein CAF53_08215 [Sphingobium sp. LB126]
MALVGWIVSFIALFGALALRQDMPIGGSATLSNMLILLALLGCPMIWRERPLGISRGQRMIVGLILFLCVPMVLLPTA